MEKIVPNGTEVLIFNNESELEPVERLGEEATNINFNFLDEQVTTLAKINIKRYLKNNLIKKNKTI